MKKRIWVIVMITFSILLMPRYTSQRSKATHAPRLPHRKVKENANDFEFHYPSKWLLMKVIRDEELLQIYA